MAVVDSYATLAEYKVRVNLTTTGDDAAITAQLGAVSRLIDRECRRFFTQDAAVVTRIFDGNGASRLWLPADIATATGLVVKVDLNGDYDFLDANESLTLDTDFWL